MSIPIRHDGRITGGDQSPTPKGNTTSLSAKILSKINVAVLMIPVALIAFLFIIMSLSFSFFFALYWLLLHRRQYCRQEYSDGLSPKCVKSLSQFKFSEPTQYGSDCVVCIEGFRQGQWCRRLPGCGHVFHRKCVDLWLLKAATCPICRDRI